MKGVDFYIIAFAVSIDHTVAKHYLDVWFSGDDLPEYLKQFDVSHTSDIVDAAVRLTVYGSPAFGFSSVAVRGTVRKFLQVTRSGKDALHLRQYIIPDGLVVHVACYVFVIGQYSSKLS